MYVLRYLRKNQVVCLQNMFIKHKRLLKNG